LAIGDYAVGDHADERNRVRLQLTQLLAGQALRVRMFGSAALDLAWLAEGKVDASITLSNRSWDVAAGVVARKAGGPSARPKTAASTRPTQAPPSPQAPDSPTR
jgi:myo-inositol-1(or 4)-monophosphatase